MNKVIKDTYILMLRNDGSIRHSMKFNKYEETPGINLREISNFVAANHIKVMFKAIRHYKETK